MIGSVGAPSLEAFKACVRRSQGWTICSSHFYFRWAASVIWLTILPLWVCACKNYKICVRNIYSEVKNDTGSLLTDASLGPLNGSRNGRSKLFNLDFAWVTLEYGLFFLNYYEWCKFLFTQWSVDIILSKEPEKLQNLRAKYLQWG
jgi:hypothetical protein